MFYEKLKKNILLYKKKYKKRKEKDILSFLFKYNFYPIDYTEDNDVFIVGYPKSGNTWMQSLISGLLYGIDTEYLPDKMAHEIVPDVHYKKFYKRFSDITFFKSHHLPEKKYKKVIYICRDGRNVLLSYYDYNNKIAPGKYSFEEMVIDGKGLFPCKWHEHVIAWYENKYLADIIFVRYEDILSDTKKEIERICKFVNIERKKEMIDTIIQGCSMQKMREKEKLFGFEDKILHKNPGSFFPKGKDRQYVNNFPVYLLEKFEKDSELALKILNYK